MEYLPLAFHWVISDWWHDFHRIWGADQAGMYYADPVKLDASERTVEFSAELCQQRCQVVPECSHFTFWPDPGTFWDDLGPFGPSRDIAKRVIRCPQSTFSEFNASSFWYSMSSGIPLWLSLPSKFGHPGW